MQKWKKLGERSFKAGYRQMLERVFRLPDGREVEFTVSGSADSVCIVALTKDREVVIAKQFRPGPEEVLYELPGGGVEPGETPRAAATRELLEETGYAGYIVEAGTYYKSAYSRAVGHVFVAIGCEKVAEPKPDQNEFIEVTTLSLEEFHWLLRSGRMTDVEVGYRALDSMGLLG